MKDFVKKYFSTRRKKLEVSQKWRKKWFSPVEKSVSPSRNKLPPAGIYFENLIPSNFNNGFH